MLTSNMIIPIDPLISFVKDFLALVLKKKDAIAACRGDAVATPELPPECVDFAVMRSVIGALQITEPAIYDDLKFDHAAVALRESASRCLKLYAFADAVDFVNGSLRASSDPLGFAESLCLRAGAWFHLRRCYNCISDVEILLELAEGIANYTTYGFYALKGQALKALGRFDEAIREYGSALLKAETEVSEPERKEILRLYAGVISECEKMKKGGEGPSSELQFIDHAREPMFELIKNAVSVGFSSDGRPFLKAASHLRPGDFVLGEKPLVCALLKKSHDMHCLSCGKYCHDYVVPCSRCRTIVYCSRACARAHEDVHLEECGLIHGLQRDDSLGPIQLMALRTVLTKSPRAWLAIADTRAQAYFDETEFYLDFSSDDRVKLDGHVLDTYVDPSPSVQTMLDLTLRAAYLMNMLKRLHFWEKMDLDKGEAERLEIFLGGVLCRLLYLYEKIMTAVEETVCKPAPSGGEEKIVSDSARIGFGVYPQSMLLRHSCAPNAVRVFHGNTAQIFIIRPVEPDEEITLALAGRFVQEPRAVRQEKIKSQLGRDCDCVACREAWPTPDQDARYSGKKVVTMKYLLKGLRWPCCKAQLKVEDVNWDSPRQKGTCSKCGSRFRELLKLATVFKTIESTPHAMELKNFGSKTAEQYYADYTAALCTGIRILAKCAEKPYHPVMWRWCEALWERALPTRGSWRVDTKTPTPKTLVELR